MGLTAATLKEQFWYLRSRIPSYLVKQFPNRLNLRSNHLPRWFFRFQSKRLRLKRQDHKKIINSESSNSHHVCLSTHLGNITCV